MQEHHLSRPRPRQAASLFAALALTTMVVLLPGCTTPPASNTEPRPVPDTSQVMCSMDAMQCPDGTWVGRKPPACQFVCPGMPPGASPAAPR